MPLKLMYITNSPEVASIAQNNGVDRIWIDLETLGKDERQKGMNTVKSKHKVSDIYRIKPLLKSSELLVRINPINQYSYMEINDVVNAGADIIMLPMWKTVEEVKAFIKFVNSRVKTVLLLETKEAVECINQVIDFGGFDEIHIGLNDLHLSYGLHFMFELLSNGLVETLCEKFQKHNIPYGFGGIAKIGEGMLPAENLLMEHYRLGSTRVILSRSFCNTELISKVSEIEYIFSENVKSLREYEQLISNFTKDTFINNQSFVNRKIKEIVEIIKAK